MNGHALRLLVALRHGPQHLRPIVLRLGMDRVQAFRAQAWLLRHGLICMNSHPDPVLATQLAMARGLLARAGRGHSVAEPRMRLTRRGRLMSLVLCPFIGHHTRQRGWV